MSEETHTLSNGAKLIGETFLPGTSLLMDGRVTEGAAHAVVGLVARTMFGPIGWGLTAANSYAKSISGKGLLGLAGDVTNNASNAIKNRKVSPPEEGVDSAQDAPPPAKSVAAGKS